LLGVASLHGLAGEERGMTFDHLAERWLALKKSDLRPGSWRRLDGILRTVKPFFTGRPVRSIGQTQIEDWKTKRGALVRGCRCPESREPFIGRGHD
jgi:hypothetical protein